MGGLAFANVVIANGKPIQVPRMSPALYQEVSGECEAALMKLFDRVVIPREAPSKLDHGDIDFLVGGIRPQTADGEIWVAVKIALGADLHLPNGGSHSYAVPHPTILDAHVQVDVELSPGSGTHDGPELFEWTRFMKGDSDLLQVIGISHRPLGLTCNDRGLHIRVEEIEPYNKKQALLFLTRDPNKAMEFYGFDIHKHRAGFNTEKDLFDWVTHGRFFSWEVYEGRVEKSNDRSRQAKRPMYRRFLEEYMPSHSRDRTVTSWTRQQVLQEALVSFDKQTEYDTMMQEHDIKEAEEDLWQNIRAIMPMDGGSLGKALKGLRNWVEFQDGTPRIASQFQEYTMWMNKLAPNSKDHVLDWVKENWKEAKALEKARTNAMKEIAKTA